MPPKNTTGTAIYYGDLNTSHVLQVFLELRDRASHRMAASLLGTMRQVADDGEFVIKFHFAGLLDDTVGGAGSQHGLSALAAAADAGQKQFIEYLGTLFAHQPFPPGEDRFADTSVLLSLAGEVDGLRSADFDRKLREGTYLTWAGEAIGNFESFGVVGTPVVWRDSEVIPVVKSDGGPAITPQEFLAQLQR
ncbi:DsbA family protein [Streptomyces carpinensis]|uniref:Thioredoxin domain-containing protein n=1 Tax=Streptomyces carpinensis TaxID=66369 RepID=A0ABV1WHW1_9ACTN|nr:thioredoxin domain-containing protein [Streptomyces carpinensis]